MGIKPLFSLALASVLILPAGAQAAVFLNEVYINPPGTSDDGREFIELLGTPGMKLDGYAIAILNGTLAKFYPLGSIPPIPATHPEINEFYSLDGLALGPNGILVIGVQSGALFWYPTLLDDSNFARWTTLWNGGLDNPGQLHNDGSFTMLLVRNRPGYTEANPPGGAPDPDDPDMRWCKDIAQDAELITPVVDPRTTECVYTPNDANCPDDGFFCNGTEFCDAVAGCVSSGDPCLPDKVCNEVTDTCDDCSTNGDCDDGVACTDDTCPAGSCVNTPNDANCPDDGFFCNGTEFCDAALVCSSTGNPCPPDKVCNDGTDTCDDCSTSGDCDDGVGCTDDMCSAGSCVYTPNHNNCPDDGFFCNGDEICDAVDDCVSTGSPCLPGEICNETTDTCDECEVSADCDDQVGCTDDTCQLVIADQWGDGELDLGQPDGLGGDTRDMVGLAGDITDDLELVDEVSFEDGRGWEYEVDGRHVDEGSTAPGLPRRHVHALDDPGGFNPDALSRVDYRTKGDGWPPATGGTGELPGGNNWQDTGTEQWIRGEGAVGTGGQGAVPQFFYVNDANTNGDAVQPYQTNVPLWLDDFSPPDYDFSTNSTYQIMASRINPLAVPFIPGDCDRDGDCDTDDIAKLAAVFGDDDWIFSNAYALAPEGDDGDPATQTRPWDVDATGDNGIEASDLQWTLNFQGDTTGQIVGIQYDSTTPAASGVILNPNTGVECTVTISLVNIPSGRTLTTLLVGDIVEVWVKGQVTAGANTTPGEKNGLMQFVHDVGISAPGVIKVNSIWRQIFSVTRESLQTLQGTDGDRGMDLVNGYATAFNLGTTVPATLYKVTLEAVGWGAADISLSPAAAAKFAASTPHGLKVGHTDSNGDPASSVYPAPLSAASAFRGDLDRDGDLDLDDWDLMEPCLTGPGGGILPGCDGADLDADDDSDLDDFSLFQLNFTGPG